MKFYFRKGIPEDVNYWFWEDHHGTAVYYRRYFVLLLAHILQNVRVDATGRYIEIDAYHLKDEDIHRLSGLQMSIDQYVSIAMELKKQTTLLGELGINEEAIDELFDARLLPFLGKLKEEAAKKITAMHKSQPISSKKIEKFKDEFVKAFYDNAAIREVFSSFLKAYENRSREKKTTREGNVLGGNIVSDKAAFFDEWHVHYSGWGNGYGSDLAYRETRDLWNQMVEHCEEGVPEDFESLVDKITGDIIVFAAGRAIWGFLEKRPDFRSKWRSGVDQLAAKGFSGWYDSGGKSIPVFDFGIPTVDGLILILNKSRLGRLIQLNPLEEGDHDECLKDVFYMNIRAFSENPELMEEFVANPPQWLKEMGDESWRREYLKEKVLVGIRERLGYDIDAVVGYRITVS